MITTRTVREGDDSVGENGEPCGSSAICKTEFCKAHGGGKRCERLDVHRLEEVPPHASYRGRGGERLCWGCFTALYPTKLGGGILYWHPGAANEHYVIAEVQRLVPELSKLETVVWD